jgi:hypothetical protein
MRLKLKLVEHDSTVNNLQYVTQANIRKGETVEIVFQLVQENGQRYIPVSGSTVELEIARNKVAIGVNWNEREVTDPSIKRAAVKAFSGDDSFWKVPLTTSETKNLISGSIKVTLTEGSKVRIAELTQAIRIIDGQEK